MNHYAEQAAIFKAISDETRLKIIDMLSCGELCACKILSDLDITQPTLSYHMKILTGCGIVKASRNGIWMNYHLEKKKADALIAYLEELTRQKENCICKPATAFE